MSWSKYKEAIESFKQAIKINPDYAEAHYRIAAAYLQTNNKFCAITHYEILKKLDSKLAKELSKYFDLFNDTQESVIGYLFEVQDGFIENRS